MEKERYAHIAKEKDKSLFFDYMFNDRKLKTEKEKKEVEASFFAMCLLLPKELFTNIANAVGGLEVVYKEPESVARFFLVEDILVRARAKDLMDREKEEQNKSLKGKENKEETKKNKVFQKTINSIKKQSQD